MPDYQASLGFADTSVIVDIDRIDRALLPDALAVSAISLAELAAGAQVATDPVERARRHARVQYAEANFQAIPFDAAAARAYGQLYAAVTAAGRRPRGGRAVDLLIAATALSSGLPFYTRNADDFRELGGVLQVVAL